MSLMWSIFPRIVGKKKNLKTKQFFFFRFDEILNKMLLSFLVKNIHKTIMTS